MSRLAAVLAMAALAGGATAQVAPDGRTLEAAFDASASSEDQIDWLRTLLSAPNHVGGPHDKANAEFILARLQEWGWDARIERSDVLYPTPISTTIEMVVPERVALGGDGRSRPTSSMSTTGCPPIMKRSPGAG